MSTPEGKVKALVKRRLTEEFGKGCWRFMPVQTGYGAVALDFLLCISGRFFAIETKAGKSELTALQETTKESLEASGAIVLVVRDAVSLDEAIARIHLTLEFDSGRSKNYRGGNAPTGEH